MEHKLHVKSLNKACNDQDLTEFFSEFGEVKKAFVIYNPQNGSSKRFGYVEFEEKEALELVMQAPQLKIGNKKITVSRFIPKGSNHLQNMQNSIPQYYERSYANECSQPQSMPQQMSDEQFQYNEYHYYDDYHSDGQSTAIETQQRGEFCYTGTASPENIHSCPSRELMPDQSQSYYDPNTWYSQQDPTNSGQEIYYSAETEFLYDYYDSNEYAANNNEYAANNNAYNGSYYYSSPQPDLSLPHWQQKSTQHQTNGQINEKTESSGALNEDCDY
jgi:RNA recognition motif-containing protein